MKGIFTFVTGRLGPEVLGSGETSPSCLTLSAQQVASGRPFSDAGSLPGAVGTQTAPRWVPRQPRGRAG